MLEFKIESRFVSEVKKLGGKAYKFISGESGVPDRIVVLPGGLIAFVELKKPKDGRLSKMQVWQHDRLQNLGAKVYVINSNEEIDKFIADMKEVIRHGIQTA